MKKFYYLLSLFIVFAVLPVRAQINLRDSIGENVVTIAADAKEQGQVSISVVGLEMIFGNAKDKKDDSKPRRKKYETHQAYFEFGFNALTSPDYSMYPDEQSDFMDLNNARSFSVALNLFHLGTNLNKSHSLGLCTSLGIMWNDYTFSDDVTIKRVDGMLQPVDIDKTYKKSKLNTFSIHLPVTIEANYKNYFISAGVYGDLVLGSHTKVKFPKEKSHNMYVNTFQAGLTARVGYRELYLFGNYGLVNLFKDGKGPKTRPVTIGFGIGF